MTANATIAHKAARRKHSLLELDSDLDKLSKACNIMGYSANYFARFVAISRLSNPRGCVKGLVA